MAERGSDKLVWGEGETIRDYLRRVDAYALLGDEKKTIGKTLLGLGHRISVIDSLSEADKSSVANLKAALLREFGDTTQQSQRQFLSRRKRDGETYGMYLSALRALFQSAYASSPGQSSTDEKSAVGMALIKSTFLSGIDSVVAGQIRLQFPEAKITDLPIHARAIEEAMGPRTGKADVCQVAEQSAQIDQNKSEQIEALRSEVHILTEAVNAIRFGNAGRGQAGGPSRGGGGGPAPGRGGAAPRWSRGPPGARPPTDSAWPAAGRSGAPRAGSWEGGPGGEARGYDARDLTCWTCGEPGHVQRLCRRAPLARGRGRPAPLVCWTCGEFGHTRYQCSAAYLN